ncbi:MAG: preprotein translocase subunit SecG [Verrucomicrobia bacterium]|jgi:preprotein translocase subunit SecG|nr:preprotein translocase subunit SecG [Verrucomicrobiota bacterium]
MALTFLYIVICLFFILTTLLSFVILIQESKSMGFGASFGGDSSNSVFGTSTPEVLKKFTAILATIFFASCLILSYWASSTDSHYKVRALPPTEMEAIHD